MRDRESIDDRLMQTKRFTSRYSLPVVDLTNYVFVLSSAHELDDAGEIPTSFARADVTFVNGRGRSTKPRVGAARARGLLRQFQVFQHHRRREPGLVGAVGG